MEPFVSNPSLYPGTINTQRYMPPALPGMVDGMGTFECYPYVNNAGLAEHWTLTMPTTPTANATYSFSVGTNTVRVTTDASPTPAELAAAILSGVRMDALMFSSIEIELNPTTNVLTVYSRQIGRKLSLSVSTTGSAPIVAARTQEAKTGNSIPYGRFVGRKADYYKDPLDGFGTASLIDSATGYEVLGATRIATFYQKVGRFEQAQEGYPFESTMDVMNSTGTFKGMWIECVEPDIKQGDPVYISVASGHEGKLTKTSSGAIAFPGSISVRSGVASISFGESSNGESRTIILCKFQVAV